MPGGTFIINPISLFVNWWPKEKSVYNLYHHSFKNCLFSLVMFMRALPTCTRVYHMCVLSLKIRKWHQILPELELQTVSRSHVLGIEPGSSAGARSARHS